MPSHKGQYQGFDLHTYRQILACLLPQDLLSMSRLSKAFRRVLLYRPTALPLWRNALRLKSGASRIPAGMNEVQLAHLVYGSDCQVGPLAMDVPLLTGVSARISSAAADDMLWHATPLMCVYAANAPETGQ